MGITDLYLAVSALRGAELAPVMSALGSLREAEKVTIITCWLDLLARMRMSDDALLRKPLLDRGWQIEGIQRPETFVSQAEIPSKDLVVHYSASTTLTRSHRDVVARWCGED